MWEWKQRVVGVVLGNVVVFLGPVRVIWRLFLVEIVTDIVDDCCDMD